MWKCKNEICERTFHVYGRISIERKDTKNLGFNMGVPGDESRRIIVEKACCPYCESIEFEEVVEPQFVSRIDPQDIGGI